MFFYEGYTCPVCKREFKETDDIVACPKCGAPHHRECWKLEGHCHYAEDHDTPRQWKRPEEAAPAASDPAGPAAPPHPAGKTCPHCGQQNTEFAEFSAPAAAKSFPASDWTSSPPSGGNPYQAPPSQPPYGGQAPYGSAQPPYGQQVPPYGRPGGYGEYTPFRMPVFDPYGGVPHEETIEDVSAEDLVTFTGSNSAYYLPKFYKMSRGGSKCVWNWASFFLTPYWLLYRRISCPAYWCCCFISVKPLSTASSYTAPSFPASRMLRQLYHRRAAECADERGLHHLCVDPLPRFHRGC